MSRPYKFRGKRIDNGEWVYGFGVFYWEDDDVKKAEIYTTIGVFDVDPETVGQYIGEVDRNGKEIYEGDIDGSDEPMYVAYEKGSYGLKYQENTNYFDNCVYWEATEIIGNIYENPELIGGKAHVS